LSALAAADTTTEYADSDADQQHTTGYLHQVDIVRLLTFGCVIGVHAVGQSGPLSDIGTNSVGVVLHFTRAVFFALTGFVLFHTGYRKPLRMWNFWWRRIPIVLIPYLVWTGIYFMQGENAQHWTNVHDAPHVLWEDILTGGASYHLYFLLVSMQIYVVFPVLRWIVQKTTSHHWALFNAVTVYNALYLTWVHFGHHTHGLADRLANNSHELLLSYIAYVIAGALAAVHLQRVHSWVKRHSKFIISSVIATLVLAEVVYRLQADRGRPADIAADPLQPSMLLWSFAVAAALYLVGIKWAEQRRPGRLAKFVSEASVASFGVYLAHPYMLSLAADWGFRYGGFDIPTPLIGLGAWTFAAVASAIFVEVIIHTPLALPLTGRRRKKLKGEQRLPVPVTSS
jgi:surface polysaccharide O-acyltransferase-like enzyme